MNFGGVLDEVRENKKSIIVIIVLIVLLICMSIFNLLFNNKSEKFNVDKALEELGKVYYEQEYYPKVKSFYNKYANDRLKDDEIKGIKLTLRNIINIFEEVSAEKFYKKGSYCDFVQTYVLINPKYPYGKKDYNIKVSSSCTKKL